MKDLVDIDLLTKNEVMGPEQLECLKIYGNKFFKSDFAVLYGGASCILEDGKTWTERTGGYWLDNPIEKNKILYIGSQGELLNRISYDIGGTVIAFRPSNFDELTNGLTSADKVLYGEYLGNAVNADINTTLNEQFKEGKLLKTGKKYTGVTQYEKSVYEEYEYEGLKYARITKRSCSMLSNGECLNNNTLVWLEVVPLNCMIDFKNKRLIPDKILLDLPYSRFGGGTNNLDFLKFFMKKYLSRELIPSVIKEKNIAQKAMNTIRQKTLSLKK